MEKPKLSPLFTMDDLYKLREYNSLRRISMNTAELVTDVDKGASKALERINQLRIEKRIAPDNIATPEDIAAHEAAMNDFRNGEYVRYEDIDWS